MKHQLRSSMSTEGRRMAGARALWVANGMKKEMMGKPIIAIVNSFTQFVPGHTHLHEIGQQVKAEKSVSRSRQKLRSWDALRQNLIPLPSTTESRWGMMGCCILCLRATSSPTA